MRNMPVLSGSLLLLLSSCNGDTTIKEVNDDPSVTMLAPGDGDVFEEGTLITFNAVVGDDDPLDTVNMRWTTNQEDGKVLYTGLAATDGTSTFDYSELLPGIHKITVTAIDPDGAVGTDSHYIEITDVADAPSVTWNHPISGEFGIETQDFEFSVLVADEQDDAILLQVFLSSDIDGEFCAPPPDQVGYATCTASLTVGEHTLTATVIDEDGNESTREAYFEVLPASGQDFDGDTWTGDQGDCNDEDPSVYPNAPEVANGVDDDCDGIVDDSTSSFDDDGDCYCELAPCTGTIEASCSMLAGDDCEDDAISVYPTAAETCDGSDEDCDGAIDEDTPCVDDDADGYTELAGDCDDGDGTIRPGAPEVADGIDQDCDGQVDDGTSAFDDDGDCYCESGVCTGSIDGSCSSVVAGDCDDQDDHVSPAEPEVCDGADNNCDGSTDESTATNASTWYQDSDGDQWGNASVTTRACTLPVGYVANSTDCNDGSAAIFPGAAESCNSVDDDCDGATDEPGAIGGPTSYQDSDSDGYGNPAVISTLCTVPAGYVSNSTDCNDANAAVFPGAAEYCNSADDDCDGTIDENSAVDALTWYRDSDSDNYGNVSLTSLSCNQPAGYVSSSTDCNDSDASIKPGAPEVCDLVDQDCDGTVDEGVQLTWYRDADSDTYGSPTTTSLSCTQPSGYVSNDDDCNDGNAAINPGLVWYADTDSDGYGNLASTTAACTQPSGYVSNSTDCNDTTSSARPGGSESCDSLDNDCDGSVDEQNATGCTSYYYDGDGDNYGTGSARCLCSSSGYYTSTNASDCYDSNANAYPSATTYYSTNRGDSSFDYNCNSANDKRYTATYTCTGAVYICISSSDGYTSGNVPSCGNSANWRSGCTADLTSCTYSSSVARTQTCR